MPGGEPRRAAVKAAVRNTALLQGERGGRALSAGRKSKTAKLETTEADITMRSPPEEAIQDKSHSTSDPKGVTWLSDSPPVDVRSIPNSTCSQSTSLSSTSDDKSQDCDVDHEFEAFLAFSAEAPSADVSDLNRNADIETDSQNRLANAPMAKWKAKATNHAVPWRNAEEYAEYIKERDDSFLLMAHSQRPRFGGG